MEILTPDDAQRIILELRMHQIELEMQNEELLRTQLELEASRSRYFDLYDLAPFGYMTLNAQGIVTEANLTAAAMLGTVRKTLLKLPISSFILPEDQDVYYMHWKRAVANCASADTEDVGVSQGTEMRLMRADGSSFWVLLKISPGYNGEYRILLTDITERKQVVEELRESEKVTSDVMDSLLSNVAVLDYNGTIVRVNESWRRFAQENCNIATISNDVGINYLSVCRACGEDDAGARDAFIGISEVLHGRKEHFSMEYSCHSPVEMRWFILNVSKFKSSRAGAVVSHTNITDRKRLEENLKNSNNNLKELVNNKTFQLTEAQRIAHIGSWELDLKKNESYWSDEVYRIFGLKPQEVPATYNVLMALIHPEDIILVNAAYSRSVKEDIPFDINHRIIRKSDGGIRYINDKCIHTRNKQGRVVKSIGTFQDVTELIVKENTLKNYAHYVVKMIEHERIRTARELHDDLGQALTVFSFAINQLKHDNYGKKNGRQALVDMQSGVDRMMESIRRICTDLRPALLDELGLSAALEWLCKNFSRRSGVSCDFTINGDCCQYNNIECQMTIFRIVQESLNNIIKHAGASRVAISLCRNRGAINLEICDDGCGITTNKDSCGLSFGIIGMRERANAIGATFDIISKEARGTSVKLVIPCLCQREGMDADSDC